MNYLLRSSQPKKGMKGKIISFVILLLFILLFFTSFGAKALKVLVTPFWKGSISLQYFYNSNLELLRSKKSLIEENQKLIDSILLKDKDLKFLSVLEEENNELKKIKGNAEILSVVASVISRPPKTPYDTLIIDSGSFSGIETGDLVIALGNVFVGEVFEVNSYMSKIKLYSSPGNKIDVLIGEEKIQKEAIGVGAGNFRTELPKEIEIKEGDIITVSSIVANIFGVVEKIEEKTTDSFKTVLFRSPINIQEIRFVEILNRK